MGDLSICERGDHRADRPQRQAGDGALPRPEPVELGAMTPTPTSPAIPTIHMTSAAGNARQRSAGRP
jgi:hypothetical protein